MPITEYKDYIAFHKDKDKWYLTMTIQNKELIHIFSNIYKENKFSMEREVEIITKLLNNKKYQSNKVKSNVKSN